MDTPTRRDLFKYAVGATLGSALPVSGHKDTTQWPLVVDLSGPMAFEYGKDAQNRNVVDVWLPHLKQVNQHEAGIVTPVGSFSLGEDENDYTITGPPYSNTIPTPYLTSSCTVYQAQYPLNANRAQNRFIRLTLPMPHCIVALLPVPAKIYTGSTPPPGLDNLATGLRFLYDQAGSVMLTLTANGQTVAPLDFDPGPCETQLQMSVEHAPFNSSDPTYTNAQTVFTELAVLFLNLRLKVNFSDQVIAGQLRIRSNMLSSPLHPCKAPVIFQS